LIHGIECLPRARCIDGDAIRAIERVRELAGPAALNVGARSVLGKLRQPAPQRVQAVQQATPPDDA
jgi:hypothetical protein